MNIGSGMANPDVDRGIAISATPVEIKHRTRSERSRGSVRDGQYTHWVLLCGVGKYENYQRVASLHSRSGAE